MRIYRIILNAVKQRSRKARIFLKNSTINKKSRAQRIGRLTYFKIQNSQITKDSIQNFRQLIKELNYNLHTTTISMVHKRAGILCVDRRNLIISLSLIMSHEVTHNGAPLNNHYLNLLWHHINVHQKMLNNCIVHQDTVTKWFLHRLIAVNYTIFAHDSTPSVQQFENWVAQPQIIHRKVGPRK